MSKATMMSDASRRSWRKGGKEKSEENGLTGMLLVNYVREEGMDQNPGHEELSDGHRGFLQVITVAQ